MPFASTPFIIGAVKMTSLKHLTQIFIFSHKNPNFIVLISRSLYKRQVLYPHYKKSASALYILFFLSFKIEKCSLARIHVFQLLLQMVLERRRVSKKQEKLSKLGVVLKSVNIKQKLETHPTVTLSVKDIPELDNTH